jgi:KaiC/GvpD/RAD55 family RecA-like ATPase
LDELTIYLDVLYDGLEGWVYSPVKTDTAWNTNWFQWPQQKEALKSHILSRQGDVYISPAIYKEQRAVKESIKKVQTVWVDFDGTEQIDFKAIDIPTLVVQTSYDTKVHCYWRVDENLQGPIEDVNRRLTYYLDADNGGWDSTQLLRPPGTINHKNGLPVKLVSLDDKPHTLDYFGIIPKVTAPAAEYVTVDRVIPVGQVLTNNSLPLQLIRMVKKETPVEPYRSSFLARLANELAEEDLSHLEIVSLLKEVDGRIKKYDGRSDQLVRLSQLADYAIHKHLAEDAVIIYTPHDILNHVDSLEWIIPQWLHTTGQLVISSAPGVGKTQLTFQLAYSLATQQRFLGLQAPTRKKVFYFSLEMDKSSLKYILAHHKNEWVETPYFQIIDESYNLKKYEDLIFEHNPDVVIVDSMIELFDDENDNPNSEARRVMKWCRKVRRRYGIAIVLIHHNRKATEGNKKPKSLADLAGSYMFAKDSDTVLQLWKDHKGFELSGVKVRFGMEEAWIIHRNNNLWFTREENASNESKPNQPNKTRDNDFKDPWFG